MLLFSAPKNHRWPIWFKKTMKNIYLPIHLPHAKIPLIFASFFSIGQLPHFFVLVYFNKILEVVSQDTNKASDLFSTPQTQLMSSILAITNYCGKKFPLVNFKKLLSNEFFKDVIFQVHKLKILWAHQILNSEMSINQSSSILKAITKLRS